MIDVPEGYDIFVFGSSIVAAKAGYPQQMLTPTGFVRLSFSVDPSAMRRIE